MWKKALIAFAFLAMFASTSRPKDAKDVVADVARTIGASDLRSIQYTGTGYTFIFGQTYTPGDPWPKFILRSYARQLDYEKGASEEKTTWSQFAEGERG